MIDQTKLKAPGWSRVVADLTAVSAADDRIYFARLTQALVEISGAHQGVMFSVNPSDDDSAEPKPVLIWPSKSPGGGMGGGGGGGAQLEDVRDESAARAAVRAACEDWQVRVFGLEGDDQYYTGTTGGGGGGSGGGYIIAVPVGGAGGGGGVAPRLVITLLLEARSPQAMRTTLALVEVVAGYAFAHGLAQQLKSTRASSAALDLATMLIASINHAPNFKGASIQLVNDIQRRFGVDRVAMGWLKGREGVRLQEDSNQSVQVVTISDTEHIDRRLAMVKKLENAMDECLDQEQPVLYPQPGESGEDMAEQDVSLARAIVHAHRELASSDANLKIASFPLRIDEQVIGVITVESTGGGVIDLGTIELIQAALDLITPMLRVRKSEDRNLAFRLRDDAITAMGWAVGSRHTVGKMVGILALIGLVLLTVVHRPYRVEADAQIRPFERRLIAAPFEGIIASVPTGIEAGVKVEKDQILVELDTTELRLNALDARAQIVQAQKQADAALRGGKVAESQQAQARADQAKAKLELFNQRIAHATIRSPIAGTLIAGDLKERVGSSVRQGDGLYEVAPLDEMKVVLKVSDSDIALITEAMDEQGSVTGDIATKAYPGKRFKLLVERIVPLAQAQDGKNIYEVHARLVGRPAGWMKPGMEGVGKLNTGEHSLLWILSRRIRDTARLWLWW